MGCAREFGFVADAVATGLDEVGTVFLVALISDSNCQVASMVGFTPWNC
jgi:hypothetical protein